MGQVALETVDYLLPIKNNLGQQCRYSYSNIMKRSETNWLKKWFLNGYNIRPKLSLCERVIKVSIRICRDKIIYA